MDRIEKIARLVEQGAEDQETLARVREVLAWLVGEARKAREIRRWALRQPEDWGVLEGHESAYGEAARRLRKALGEE